VKVGVLGTINRDTVKFPDGSTRLGWGGILYNLRALAKFMHETDLLVPACHVGRDCYAPIMLELKRLKRVDCSHVVPVKKTNNHCRLTYHDAERKSEILEGGVPRLRYADIEALHDCQYVLVNFISGRDVHLPGLEKFRKFYRGEIYTDIHSYTLGRARDGSRYLRTPKNWPRVVGCSDFIQMNRTELAVLISNNYEKHLGRPIEENVGRVIEVLRGRKISPKNRMFIVTEGAEGCTILGVNRNRLHSQKYRPRGNRLKGDTTGCGDSFGAGFLSGIARRRSLEECVATAIDTASECIKINERWRNHKK